MAETMWRRLESWDVYPEQITNNPSNSTKSSNSMPPPVPAILLTVDVEDWFQVENFKPWISFETWPSRELRVEKNTHKLLDLFDSIKLNNPNNPINTSNPKATFFILGWLAERLPHLVREIHQRGHEIASHGYHHELCNQQSDKDLEKDLTTSKKLLEDIVGSPVSGYRAPSFSISSESLKIIENCGYQYDSSYNSFAMHGRYGRIDFSSHKKQGIAFKVSDGFFEVPISNLKTNINDLELPWGGGGYFRLTPFCLFNHGVKKILKRDGAYVFYMHPWEIDEGQPRVSEAASFLKFRHYIHLNKTAEKLRRMFRSFSDCRFITCKNYIEGIA